MKERLTFMRFWSPITVASLFVCAGGALAGTPDLLNSVPLRFEASDASQQHWAARGQGFAVYFDGQSTVVRTGGKVVRLTLDGSNPEARLTGSVPSGAPTSYFSGHTFRSAKSFARLRRANVYPGIDMVFYGRGGSVEYDFELAPGADASAIKMRFEGADDVRINARREIELRLGGASLIQQPPAVYQRKDASQIVAVEAGYQLDTDGSIGMALGAYRREQPLVIDPTLLIQAYLAGSGGDGVVASARDAKGFLYLAGYTYSNDFPLVGDSFQVFNRANISGNADSSCWLMKLNPYATDPNQLIVYSTFFGGSLNQTLTAMTVDPASGIIYFTGSTDSADFPYANAYNSTATGTNINFFSVLDPAQGSNPSALLYSTLFGGTKTEATTGIAVSKGIAYISGYTLSDDFPVANGFQATRTAGFDAFLAVFDINQDAADSLVYSTYFGGTGEDIGRSVAVDSAGRVYLAGGTLSTDLPTTPFAYRPFYSGQGDGFLAVIDMTLNIAVYTTYVGGTGWDEIKKILIDPAGRVAIAGFTLSTDYPVTAGAAQLVPGGNGDAFLTILDVNTQNFTQALIYSTYYGGSGGEVAYDMRRDPSGRYVLAGYTLSQDLPLGVNQGANSINKTPWVGVNGMIAVIDPAVRGAAGIVSGSYISSNPDGYQIAYAVEVDPQGNIFVGGLTTGNIYAAGPPQQASTNTNGFLIAFHL
jgi:hypothetical protein